MIKIDQKISVVICAYNEADNIANVLKVLEKIDWLDQIIVIDDCSEDNTSQVARNFDKVTIITHCKNQGKGGALATGIDKAEHELIIFLDADLLGLSELHLKKLVAPLLFTGEADMTLGVFGKGEISATNIANRMIPGISGQRAVWKSKLPDTKLLREKRFGVDIFLTHHIEENREKVIQLDGLSQVTKEDKSKNVFEAMGKRFKMYGEIIKTINDEKKHK